MQLQDFRKRWYIDSGALDHMCYLQDLFVNFIHEWSTIYLGDGRLPVVRGRGHVRLALKLPDGTINQVQLTNNLFIPDLSANLVSVMALTRKYLAVSFTGDGCSTRRLDGSLLAVGTKNESLYSISLAGSSRSALLENRPVAAPLPMQLWHQRLGHLGYDSVRLRLG
jgi:hypothetical protein